MKRPNPLIEAYRYIKNIYEIESMDPGILEKIIFSPKWTGVFADRGQTGVAFNYAGEHLVYGPVKDLNSIEGLKRFIGQSLFSLAEYLLPLDEDIHMRSICLSTLNALSRPLILRGYPKDQAITKFNASKDIDFILPEDIVVIIGYGRLIDQVYGRCKELHVMDMRPKHKLTSMCIDKNIGYGSKNTFIHSSEENEEILSKADVVLITGATLVNGTFLELIKYSKVARVIGMYGPSAQILPDILLNSGINYIGSSIVTKPDVLESILMDNFSTRHMFKDCMDNYVIKGINQC